MPGQPFNPPDIFDYLDYRKYLGDWFAARKAANPRFSHRAFSRKAGVASPSLLLLIIQGKRNLTEAMLDHFARALELTDEEGRFLRLLTRLDHAQSVDQKNEAWAQLSATKRFQEAHRVKGEGFRYLSHWYFPAIRELATSPHFRSEPAWIAQTLRPTITEAQATEGLELLKSLGLLVSDGQGHWIPASPTIVTPHEVSGLALHNYHAGMLKLAAESMSRTLASERHLCAVTVCISPALIPTLKQRLSDFQEALLDLCDSHEGERRQVVQIGLQVFPLSEPLLGDAP